MSNPGKPNNGGKGNTEGSQSNPAKVGYNRGSSLPKFENPPPPPPKKK